MCKGTFNIILIIFIYIDYILYYIILLIIFNYIEQLSYKILDVKNENKLFEKF